MTPPISELVAVLDREGSLIKELIDVLQRDQKRIIQQDVDALEESNRSKEALVLRFQVLEDSRAVLTQQLGAQLGLAADDVRVSKICPLLGPQGQALQDAAAKLRALIESLQELLAIGRGFLEQSILGIRGLLGLIQSLRTGEPQTYDAAGRFQPLAEPEAMTIRREV